MRRILIGDFSAMVSDVPKDGVVVSMSRRWGNSDPILGMYKLSRIGEKKYRGDLCPVFESTRVGDLSSGLAMIDARSTI